MHTKHIIFILSLVLSLAGISGAHAQVAPQTVLTWQALNFYPVQFTGKAFPANGTPVRVSVEVIENGKIIDLSKATVSWYLDDARKKEGVGAKDFSFTVSNEAGDSHIVEARIVRAGKESSQYIRIPVVAPSVALAAPYPSRSVAFDSEISITALPYFFNASSLSDFSFSWQIDTEKRGTGSDNKISLKVEGSSTNQLPTIPITTYAQNKKNLLELASTQLKLFVQ